MFRKLRRELMHIVLGIITCVMVFVLLFTSSGNSNEMTDHMKVIKPHHISVPIGPRKVIILSYMRSGSTFLGELSQQNPGHLYWFEPMDGLYSSLYGTWPGWFPEDIAYYTNGTARSLDQFEQDFLTRNLLGLLNCDFSNVAAETLGGYDIFRRNKISMSAFAQCLQNIKTENKTDLESDHTESRNTGICDDLPIERIECCKWYLHNLCKGEFNEQGYQRLLKCHRYVRGEFDPELRFQIKHRFHEHNQCLKNYESRIVQCLPVKSRMCKTSEARVMKTIRLTMEIVEHLLHKDPTIKIIHLLRDPRGIVNSRRKWSLLSRVSNELAKKDAESADMEEARLLCQKMLKDIRKKEDLEQAYPSNFLTVRYEDMSQNPNNTYHQVYTFLGLSESESVQHWLQQTSEAKADDNPYGTNRQNGLDTSIHWQKEMTVWKAQTIANVCSDVLQYMSKL